MKSQHSILVADIGGTNARFASANKVGKHFSLSHQVSISSSAVNNLPSLVKQYLQQLPASLNLEGACLALAGPVSEHGAYLTNLDWNVVTTELASQLSLSNLILINDFAAYANSIPLLDSQYIYNIKSGSAQQQSPILVLGPGTGFGIASLIPTATGFQPIACEGGHMSLASQTEQQDVIIAELRKQGFVSIETILCGPGLVNLYRVLSSLHGITPMFDSAAEISHAALQQTDDIATESLSAFCFWLGQIVGDLVLAHGALGGVILGGGILPRIHDFLIKSDFIKGMLNKGRMSTYLEDVPVSLAMKSDTALHGAAAWWWSQFDDMSTATPNMIQFTTHVS